MWSFRLSCRICQFPKVVVTNYPWNAGDVRDTSSIPGWEDPLEEGTATHSNILAWKIPWTEEPGRLQSIVLDRVEHNWSNLACMSWIKTIQMIPLQLGRSWIHTQFHWANNQVTGGAAILWRLGEHLFLCLFQRLPTSPRFMVPPSIFKVHHSNFCLDFFSLNILILLPPLQKEGPLWLHWAHLENSGFSHYLQILN